MLNKLLHRRGWSWYAARTPKWLMWMYNGLTWSVKTKEKKVFLTFDDGPIPIVTEFVLDTLRQHQVKAHFFCIGKNVAANATIYDALLAEGHVVGNHTYNHLNGWKTPTNEYIHDVQQAATYIKSTLYRPPYGRVKRSQIKQLKKLGFQFVMWDVLSGDFDNNISPELCYKNVVQNIQPGSIIVFHDSEKAFERLQYALPLTLNWLKDNGYTVALLQ